MVYVRVCVCVCVCVCVRACACLCVLYLCFLFFCGSMCTQINDNHFIYPCLVSVHGLSLHLTDTYFDRQCGFPQHCMDSASSATRVLNEIVI